MTENELIAEITAELTIELRNQPTFDADILALKVKDAYRKVRLRRCYEYSSKNEQQIIDDLYNYYICKIKELAMYYFAKIGGDFELSHSENGTSRSWINEDSILSDVTSFVKVL